MKVLLVFRDKRKKGKSIEGIFNELFRYTTPDLHFLKWEYNSDKSLLSNLTELKAIKSDIIHITGDINYLAILLWPRRTVLTIHDIGHYKELKGLKKWIYKKIWIEWPAVISSAVTVVSEYTQKDLLALRPSLKNKVQVIHNGYSPEFKASQKEFYKYNPRILQVGTAINKNIETLIYATKNIHCQLIIIGDLHTEHKKLLDQHETQYENYTDLEQSELIAQYVKSDMVVFISTHEGFGMPVLEAQAVGVPVIASRIPAIEEISGDGALFIENPYDSLEIKRAIEHVINNDDQRKDLVTKGYENASKYTFKSMAESYERLYKKIVL